MAAGRFVLVTFNFAGKSKTDELLPTFNLAIDWIRYAPNCWILWTTSDPTKWYERLKPKIDEKDHMFIVEVNLNERAGWLPRFVWDWVNKERDES